MTLSIEALPNYRKILDSISQYTPRFPHNARRRLLAWLLWEKILHKPALPPPGKQIPNSVRRQIENQASLFSGYMVMFAHDDAVDKYNLNTSQIYGQLSRCLAAFLMSIPIQDEPRTIGALRSTMSKWSDRMRETLLPYPKIAADLPYLFDVSSVLRGQSDDEPLSIRSLFFKYEHDALCHEWLNMTIFSAMEMGLAFREISSLIEQWRLIEDESALQRRSEFLVMTMVKCMYAQARSPEQRDLETIRYERYVELACLKSNVLLDMPNYVSDQMDEPRYFATRYNSSRCCEQLYDDLQDFEEDTRDGTLNVLHMHIMEQGRLAEKFLALTGKKPLPSAALELLNDTVILQAYHDRTFIYSNPYIQSARDERGNPRLTPENVEMILREIWVNSPEEAHWTVESLARHRLSLYQSFKTAWQTQDYPAVLDIVYCSNFPSALLQSLYRFMNQNKRVIIESHKEHRAAMSGYLSYLLVRYGITALQLAIWKKKTFRTKYA